VAVHPNQFHAALETVPAAGWQVIQEDDGLHVLLTGLRDPAAPAAIGRAIRDMLDRAGVVAPPIRVRAVEQLQRGATGKAPLILSRTAARVG
jgi:hypothetical protein